MQLADPHARDAGGDRLIRAADFFRRFGLQVPCLLRSGPAPEKHLNAGPGSGFKFRGRLAGGPHLRRQKLWKRQPPGDERSDLQPLAARHAVTKLHPRVLEPDH